MRFEPDKFQALDGLEASRYALSLAKEGLSELEVLPYFQENIAALDMPHLEVAVYLLAKVGTSRSWHMVSNYLDHPEFRIRFVATKMLRDITVSDEVIMKNIVESMSKLAGDGLADELKLLLDRPANAEARRIASEYIPNTKK
jgi:hypothetical protein